MQIISNHQLPIEPAMEWKITIHQEDKFIEVVTKGVADKDGSLEMAKEIAKVMRANRYTKAIIDHRAIEKVSGEIIDIYDRPKLFRMIGIVLGIKIAEVINPEHLAHFRFFETVCINRGYRFSIFYERAEALRWLFGKSDTVS
jgi:hypothetical protein